MLSSVDASAKERRTCAATGESVFLDVPSDPQVREVYRAIEAQDMLNAVGRARPLDNPDTEVWVVDEAPLEGVQATQRLTGSAACVL